MDSNHRSLSRGSRFILRKVNCAGIDGRPNKFGGVPMVRIHLPPPASLRTSVPLVPRAISPTERSRNSLPRRQNRDAAGDARRDQRSEYSGIAFFRARGTTIPGFLAGASQSQRSNRGASERSECAGIVGAQADQRSRQVLIEMRHRGGPGLGHGGERCSSQASAIWLGVVMSGRSASGEFGLASLPAANGYLRE